MGVSALGREVSFWGDENILGSDSGEGCTAPSLQQKPLDYTLRGELYSM